MAAFLTINRPRVQQWYDKRNRALTGCTVIHTAESVMDSVGPDTGAENVAKFIQGRTDPGSYHDLVDSDSWVPLVDLKHGAFHDGTGSNNWALSLSFACRTSDWRTMSAAKRLGFMRQGARAWVNQQLYRRATKAPLSRLRLITKADSDRGEAGCTYHGFRDPGRRSDPGIAAPNLFPFGEFVDACREELARVMPDHPDAPGQVGNHPITGAILGAYSRVLPGLDGATWGFFIGKPKGPASVTWAKDAYWQEFEKGAIYAHDGAAYVMWGDILKCFWALGSETKFGYPVTDERATPDGIGRYNHFAGGPHGPTSIYWTPQTGAQPVWGWFRRDWEAQGWETGSWGYPTSPEYTVAGVITQDFQGGRVELRDGKVVFLPR